MRVKYIIYLFILVGSIVSSCKRDKAEQQTIVLPAPEIAAVDRVRVQSGDTLVVTGKHLQQQGLTTEIFLAGRPLKIVKQSETQLQLVVPEKIQSGSLILHIGKQMAEGPGITVVGTPKVLTIFPRYAFAGDTLTITGNDLSDNVSHLKVWLGQQAVKVTYVNQDTAKFIVPGGTDPKAMLSWQTFGGPVYKLDSPQVRVRPVDIKANTILEYLQKDPGMDLMEELLTSMITVPTNKQLNDTLGTYMKGERPCIIFLPNSASLNKIGIYGMSDMGKINGPVITVFNSIHAQLVPMQALQPGILYPSAYTNYIYNYDGGDPDLHAHITILVVNGEKYVVSTMNTAPDQTIQPTGQQRRILKEHICGNSILYETDGFIDWPNGIW
jgi:hypothetical protein